ncbi:MAG: thioredoxin family protein [Flavobacteriales bacterium]|nr:thioredoxin family protein [Bacteroidota bacterium]MCB9239629.1 thioredoxin family protein [Flavobacteriales bacterium]
MNIGDKLFRFELKATDGRTYNSFSYADRSALLIIVTCNHCPYARAYWKRFIKLNSTYEEDNLGIIAINPNDANQYPEDSFDNMVKLMKDLGNPFVYAHDEDQSVTKRLGASRTPEVFLFNSKRELVYRGAIDDSWDNENSVTRVYLEDAIEHALDGLEVDFPEVPPVGCSIKWKPGNEPQ